MKVSIKLQIRNVDKHLRVTVYEQENGLFYAIRVRTNQHPEDRDALTIRGDISRDEAIGMAEL